MGSETLTWRDGHRWWRSKGPGSAGGSFRGLSQLGGRGQEVDSWKGGNTGEVGGNPEARGRCLACQAKEFRSRFLPGVHEALGASVSPEMVPHFVSMCVFFLERAPGISSYFQNLKNPTVL